MSRSLYVAFALVGVVGLVILVVLMTRSSGLPWEQDYTTALAHAKARNQMVVTYLHTDWCTYCKRMEAETFPSDPVKREAGRYVWLKLNAEKDEDGARLRQLYEVSGYPTILFLDGNGRRLDQIEGFMPPDIFVQAVSEVSARVRALEALKAEVRQQPASVPARYALAERYLEVRDYREAAAEFAQVIEADPENRQAKNEISRYRLALCLASLREYGKAQQELDILADKFPGGQFAPQATILRGQVFYQQGETEKARASFGQFLQKYPANENAGLVRRMLAEIGPALPLSASH